jgi:hypothetical protein
MRQTKQTKPKKHQDPVLHNDPIDYSGDRRALARAMERVLSKGEKFPTLSGKSDSLLDVLKRFSGA